jgi:NADP-dependent alcohol dehydrogenase
MNNFSYFNPTKIIFGKGTIASLKSELPANARILVTYGGGSIKNNGVYRQVAEALKGYDWLEFGGIEPNPRYETLMKAVEAVKNQSVTMLLAVGGGSVLDGTKFIAAAASFQGEPWDILAKQAPVPSALPLAIVLTLPATGSESNAVAVISRESTREKLVFRSPHCFPKFAILDPETTYSLPLRQIANGVVDAFIHVIEQYLTYPAAAPLQDRLAEGILLTLLEVGPRALSSPLDYDARSNLMWCATLALNGLIGCGVPQDWSTHAIGHELTVEYGLDHAQTLAVVLPGILRSRREEKKAKLLQYADRIWGIREGSEEERIDAAIERTEKFFISLGVPTRLSGYPIQSKAAPKTIAARLEAHGMMNFGERGTVTPRLVEEILASRL